MSEGLVRRWDSLSSKQRGALVEANVYSNNKRPMVQLLNEQLREAEELKIASAFLNSAGLERIQKELDVFLNRGGKLELIHGADFRIADPDAIKTLVGLNSDYSGNMVYRVVPDWKLLLSQKFHPKLYMSKWHAKGMAIIGSSNLTGAGLETNSEVNAVFRAEATDLVMLECEEAFQELRDLNSLVEPDAAWVKIYEEVFESAKRTSFEEPDATIQKKIEQLNQYTPQTPSWKPVTLFDVVIQALQNLTQNGGKEFIHLQVLYEEVERVARYHEMNYVWSTLHNSTRGALNTHWIDTGPAKRLFERGAPHSGMYRLTNLGRRYRRNEST